MQKIPITREGFAKLKKELETLKNVSIPENIRDIEVARAHGDLSENAEYTAAKKDNLTCTVNSRNWKIIWRCPT